MTNVEVFHSQKFYGELVPFGKLVAGDFFEYIDTTYIKTTDDNFPGREIEYTVSFPNDKRPSPIVFLPDTLVKHIKKVYITVTE